MTSLSGPQTFCVIVMALIIAGSVATAFANRNKPRDPDDPPL